MKESSTNNKRIYSTYRKLLVKPASLDNLDNLISIYKQFVNKNLDHINYSDNEVKHRKFYVHETMQRYNEKYKTELETSRLQDLQFVLCDFPDKMLKNIEEVSDNSFSFLSDLALLIYHNAFYSLYDAVNHYGKSKLLEIFYVFSNFVVSGSDRAKILAEYFEMKAKPILAKESYRTSLALLNPNDHDFMTSLQIYITFCLENKFKKDALDILLWAARNIMAKDREELDEMFILVYNFSGKSKN